MLYYISIFSFFCVFYAYFGYPLTLAALIKLGFVRKSNSREDNTFTFSIIIAVRNEEKIIVEKIENTLSLSFEGVTLRDLLSDPSQKKVQCIIASDASDDKTHEIVNGYKDAGVELVALEERKGKEAAQVKAIAHARGEILLLTDAKIFLEGEVLSVIQKYFQEPTVGILSSIDQIIDSEGKSSGEGFYIKYEMKLRELESRFNSLVGVSGSCFAVRKELTGNLSTDIPSDFSLLIETVKQGMSGVHAPDLVARYKAVRSEKEEFSRKIRTVLRGITTFFSRAEVLNPFKYGVFTWQIISHKLGRWLVPFFGFLFVLSSFLLSYSSSFYLFVFCLILVFLFLAALGFFIPRFSEKTFCKLPLFFIVSNLGIAFAWRKFLSGQRSVTWEPSKKGG